MKYTGSEAPQCPGSPSPELRSLWKRIRRKCSSGDPEQVIPAFYTWITTHIRYDADNYWTLTNSDLSQQIQKTETDPVCLASKALTSRKTLCTGFTDLLYHFCRYSNIVCVKVKGHVKGHGYIPGDVIDGSAPNHQWLAVCVRRRWRLLDPTWDSGYISLTTGHFVSTATTRYLFAEPGQFVLDHLALDSRWQLLGREALDPETFRDQPRYGPTFLSCRFACSITEAVILVDVGECYRFGIGCDAAKRRLDADSLTVVVRELTSGLVMADFASLSFDDASNMARVEVTVDFPSTFVVEVYLVGEGCGHVISALLRARPTATGYPLLRAVYIDRNTPSDVTFSDIVPRDTGQFTIGVKAKIDVHLKVIVYRILNRRLIPVNSNIQHCYPERKLMFSIPEDGAYKVVIYGRHLDTREAFEKLYTSISLMKIRN